MEIFFFFSKSVSGYFKAKKQKQRKKFKWPLSRGGGKGLSGRATKKNFFCGFLYFVVEPLGEDERKEPGFLSPYTNTADKVPVIDIEHRCLTVYVCGPI